MTFGNFTTSEDEVRQKARTLAEACLYDALVSFAALLREAGVGGPAALEEWSRSAATLSARALGIVELARQDLGVEAVDGPSAVMGSLGVQGAVVDESVEAEIAERLAHFRELRAAEEERDDEHDPCAE